MMQSSPLDHLSSLPPELLFDIAIRFLELPDILRLGQTSRFLYQLLCQPNITWKLLYERDLSKLRPPKSCNYREVYQRAHQEIQTHHPDQIIAYAAEHGYEQLVAWALHHGAAQYAKALIMALVGDYQDIIDELYRHGKTNLNEALAFAARHGYNNDILDRLIAHGANYYMWAAMEARNGGHLEIVDRLMYLFKKTYVEEYGLVWHNDDPGQYDRLISRQLNEFHLGRRDN